MNFVDPDPISEGLPRRPAAASFVQVHPSAAHSRRRTGFAGRAPRRLTATVIVALHLLLVWGLARYGLPRDPSVYAPPLLVQLLAPAPADAPPLSASLPSPPKTRLPDPPVWVPPPEVPMPTPREPVVHLPSMVPTPATAPMPRAEPAAAVQAPIPAPIASAAPVSRPEPVPTQALPTAALRFSQPPVVDYPRASRRNKESGVVWIRAWVGAAGGASPDVRVERSSGFVRLDEAALRAVLRARFTPTVQDGRATEGWAVFPINFALEP